MYLNNILKTSQTQAMKFPIIEGRPTFCFNYYQTYKNELKLCPNIGIENNEIFNIFFKEYRITALNIHFDGECCITKKSEFDPKISSFETKIIYYPPINNILTIQSFTNDSTWYHIKAPIIKVYIHYEIVPLFPLITIPSLSYYTDMDYFINEYQAFKKHPLYENKLLNDLKDNDKAKELINQLNGISSKI